MDSNQIAALTIGLIILFIILFIILIINLIFKKQYFTENSTFYLKKWLYIAFIFTINIGMCITVYYVQNIPVMLYIILFLKSKDLISSIIFLVNMLYKQCRISYDIPNISNKNIIAFVPVYNETLDELTNTVNSILNNNINNNYLLTCIISDSNKDYTNIFDNILLYHSNLSYKSWNNKTVLINIYYGIKQNKHIILIEKDKNYGKKDSIILVNNLFNNINSLNFKKVFLDNLNVLFTVNHFDYLFTTDSDTSIDNNAIIYLMDTIINRDANACCGIVNVNRFNNKWFWNNIQNFQYLYGQYMRRTTEDLLKQVLCLPGCITLYKINDNTNDAVKLFSELPDNNDFIISNAQYIGTDRRFTGSLLYTNSNTKICMDIRSHAYTTAPFNLNSYIVQRRRWMQNTYFNTLINMTQKNINLLLRFFCLVDYLKLTLIYFRLFNTIYFIYLLSKYYKINEINKLIPYLVILLYPIVIFFLYAIINNKLRSIWINLLISYILNKLLIVFSNLFIFTTMLFNIGNSSWKIINNDLTSIQITNNFNAITET
jgi:cellulose synthase/poly-beta-1,6-N-acetylglucosamine synthase-like glycosyltransferase